MKECKPLPRTAAARSSCVTYCARRRRGTPNDGGGGTPNRGQGESLVPLYTRGSVSLSLFLHGGGASRCVACSTRCRHHKVMKHVLRDLWQQKLLWKRGVLKPGGCLNAFLIITRFFAACLSRKLRAQQGKLHPEREHAPQLEVTNSKKTISKRAGGAHPAKIDRFRYTASRAER